MLRVVLDTNQFVSSLISKQGIPAQILNAWKENQFILISSTEILAELREVLTYPRILKKYLLSEEDIHSLLILIEQEAVVLTQTIPLHVIKEDPDDNKFLAAAWQAKADLIVSGDNHLLSLVKYKNIEIVTARQFLNLLQS